MSQGPTPGELGDYVDQAAKLVGLEIAPEHRPGVIRYLTVVLGAAALVREFSLPEDVEAAPVFRP